MSAYTFAISLGVAIVDSKVLTKQFVFFHGLQDPFRPLLQSWDVRDSLLSVNEPSGV